MKPFNSPTHIKLLTIALVLGLSACASKKTTETDPAAETPKNTTTETVSTQGTDDGSVSTVTNSNSSSLDGMSESELAQLLNQKEFFFAYDSFTVDSKSEMAILAHARFLNKTPSASVRLEGHTDERGTREYNLALGERRAKSVSQILLGGGARSSQIEVITYGEEKPKAQGTDEGAYAQNRRVDIEYTVGRP
jgi:peptidoglycan-associated lipoprotein